MLGTSGIVTCDSIPEDIGTVSYADLISDPMSPLFQIEVEKNKLTWEEYSKQEKHFEALTREAEGVIYDLLIEEQEKENKLQEESQWKVVQELIKESCQNNRKRELEVLLREVDKRPYADALDQAVKQSKRKKKTKTKVVKKKRRRGRKKKKKQPIEKYVWNKPDITEEKKKKIKKRAKGLAAYLEKFL